MNEKSLKGINDMGEPPPQEEASEKFSPGDEVWHNWLKNDYGTYAGLVQNQKNWCWVININGEKGAKKKWRIKGLRKK